MRSTFRVLFYTKNQAIKNGRIPVMGRITVNGTTASFSCKRDVPLALWDAKGKSEEARRLNRELENIKAQIGKHYQYLSDHDSFLTAKKVYDRYNGFGEEIHSLMEIFNIQIRDYKRQIGKTKAQSTYRGVVDEYKCLSCYLKDKLGTEDIPLMSLDMDFIKNYYNWMLSVRGLAKSTAFERVNTLKWLMYLAMDEGWIHKHPFKKFVCKPEYFPLGGGPATRYQRQAELQAAAGHPGHVCFHVLQRPGPCRPEGTFLPECPHGFGREHLAGWKPCEAQGTLCCQAAPDSRRADREIQGGERIQGLFGQGVPRGRNREYGGQSETYRREGRLQCPRQPACRTSYFCDPGPEQGHAAETLQKVLGHKTIISTQVYAELINPKIGEDTDRMREKIGGMFRLAN